MMKALRRHHISFKNAFAGISLGTADPAEFPRPSHSFRACSCLGMYLRITSVEMTIITFYYYAGLAAEMINTALESMTDLITTRMASGGKNSKRCIGRHDAYLLPSERLV